VQQIAAVDRRVVVVKLRRNFGQTSALAAGFDHAKANTLSPWMATCNTILTTFHVPAEAAGGI